MGTLADENATKLGLWTPTVAGSLSEQNVQKDGIYLPNLASVALGPGFGTLSDINARRLGLTPASLGAGGGAGPAPPAGFAHYSFVTTNPAQCGASDSANFTMWIAITDPRFKSVSNGGFVNNVNGYDIRPYDALVATPLNYELEFYDPVGGTVMMWILLANLSHSSPVQVALCYNNPSLSTNGSSTAAWDANYRGVYHLGNGSVLSLLDSSAAGYNLTNLGSTVAGAGILNGGAVFAGGQILYADGSNVSTTPITISCWAKLASIPGASVGIAQISDVNNANNMNGIAVVPGPLFQAGTLGSASVGANGVLVPVAGTWYYVVGVFSLSNSRKMFVNGAQSGVDTSNCTTTSLNRIGIGALALPAPGNYFSGTIDEVRYSNIARSPDWILQNYNNQSSPSTFYTLGPQV